MVVGDNLLIEAQFCASAQDVVQMVVAVLVHPDEFAGAQSAHGAIVYAAEQFLFIISR